MNIEIKKMMSVTMIAIMLMATGVTAVSAAGQDDYGTQVIMCETDDTYTLNLLPTAAIVGVNNLPATLGFEDDLYLDVAAGGSFVVSVLDIRLTPVVMQDQITGDWFNYPAGSQVEANDLDVTTVTPYIVPPGALMYWDMPVSSPGGGLPFPNGLYDISDPVYYDTLSDGIVNDNDVRITGYMSYQAGAKVGATDTDRLNVLSPLPNTAVGYYDIEGNGQYNLDDYVVLDASLDLVAMLGSTNDIRLTEFDSCGVKYKYGTKLMGSQSDVVHVLGTVNQNAPFALGYWDRTFNGYTIDDPVYIDVTDGLAGWTSPGDIRLTPVNVNVAGSQMYLATDPDMGQVLQPIIVAQIVFLDLLGDGYTLDDPVYVDMEPSGTVSINDVILSDGYPSSNAGIPGSKVVTSSPYKSLVLKPMPIAPAATNVNYFDTNGDGWYSNPISFGIGDYVFLDVGGQQFSSANDVRLTQPTFGYPFGSKVLVDDDCSVDRLTTFWPFVFLNSRLQSVDLLDDGFTADDLVLLDTSPFWAGVLQVEVGDVRLTPVTWLGETHAAGTTVESGDKDEWKTTNFIPWNNIRYYDVNGDGLTNDDPIIVDSLGGGSVSNLDVRLTSYAGFAAGSKVLDGDGDPYFSLGLITLPNVQAGFFDVDDRRYDEDDYVYIDLYGDNFVTVNDVRLTGNGAPPPPPELMEGDVTGDNCVDTVDAMLIAQYRAGLISLTADQLKCADTTDDGSSDMIDAMHIKQWRVDPDGSLGVLAKPLWESPADDDMLHPDDCRP